LTILGLPSRTTWQDLKDLMRKAGEVQYTNVSDNGDGVVEFIDAEGKEKALDMFKDYDYNGSTLTLRDVIQLF
jgi:splicing factor, arginine/serine-rich 4/5/6